MKRKAKRSANLIGVALEYSDGVSKGQIVLLCIVSLICAACNVLGPILQKYILSTLDQANDSYLWLFLTVTIVGAVFLMLENFINISIMVRFRRELESVMESSLAFKEQPLIEEKGVGVFAAAVTGDSEQLSRVLAAGWFSLAFNLIGAVISIIISATWELYFFTITLSAYVIILFIIWGFNRLSVHYFRKEKYVSYAIGSKVREMADTHHTIMSYGDYLGYQDTFKKELDERGRYARASERALSTGSALIKLVQGLAIAIFFFFVVKELRAIPSADERYELFPTIIALVGFFTTIFAPITALNTTYNNASKFRAFYEPYKGVVAHEGVGEFPHDLAMKVHHVSLIEDGVMVLQNIDFDLDKIYGVIGLEGEGKSKFMSYLHGESYPPEGHIELGSARIYEIEKNLRLSLLTFNPSSSEVFGLGLQYNVTLGKELLDDEEYDRKREEYFEDLRKLFVLVDKKAMFRRGANRALTARVLRDFFAIDERLYKTKSMQIPILSEFAEITDREGFIHSVGSSIFAKKYARKSRYYDILERLNIINLEDRAFGVSGKKLPDSDRALVLLARFLLPETDNPFVLIDPLEHLPIDSYKAAVKAVKETTKGRKGLIFCQDVEALAVWTDEILLFDEGSILDHGPHAKLLRRSKEYQKLCAQYGVYAPKKK